MSRNRSRARNYIQDMLESCDRITEFNAGRSRESFLSDIQLQFATLRALEIIGEASKQLGDVLPDAAARFPQLDFQTMYALRNKLIHGYSTVNMEIIWDVVERDIPTLRPLLQSILANWPADLT